MSFCLSSCRWCLALVILWGGVILTHSQTPSLSKENSVRPPGTNSPATLPALNPAGGRRDALKQLEEELSKSLGTFAPQSSLDGVLAPRYHAPPAAAVPTKKLQEELERRKNWGFIDPETTMGGMADDSQSNFNLEGPSSGKQSKRGSSTEKLYDRISLENDGTAAPGFNREGDPSRRKAASTQHEEKEDDNMPASLKSRTNRLKELLKSDSNEGIFSTGANRSSFSDFFGLGSKEVDPERELAHKQYMERARQILDQSATPSTTLGTANPLSDSQKPRTPGYTGGLEGHSGLAPAPAVGGGPGGINSFLQAGTLPDRNATVLNQWNLLYTTPKPEAPPPTLSSSPTLEVPRRKF
jgi:hypothetical protein